MTFPKLLIPVLVLAAACVPVSATTVIYCNISGDCGPSNNLTAFNNATTSLFFPNAPILFTSSGLSADTTTYTDTVSTTEFLEDNSSGTAIDSEGFFSPVVTGLKTFTPGDVIQVMLPANVYAFEVNVQVSSSNGGGVCVETTSSYTHSCSGDEVFLSSSSDTEPIGVVSSSPLTTVWLAAPSSSNLQLDNFEIGEQAPDPPPADTPEVATMFMIGTGLISLGVMRRRVAVP
jgi:hypothetical protein